ncbi:MAG: hypothetical protein AAFX52_11090 [Pseudomonadota bacterium]
MVVRTYQELLTDIATELPTNNNNEVKALNVRTVLNNLADSLQALFDLDDLAEKIYTRIAPALTNGADQSQAAQINQQAGL